MDISLEIVYVGFFVVLLTWVLLDIMGRRRDDSSSTRRADRGSEVFAWVTICSNALISIFYLGFGVYEYWGGGRIVSCKSIFSGMTWILATVVTLYAMNRTHSEQNRWPRVLVIWWIFDCSFYVLYACLYLITHFISIDLPHILPKANIVDFASFPLSILLCFNAFSYAAQKNNDLKQPLLEKEDEAPPENTDTYSNAGIWSKATFQWLNPLFRRGRIQKLELPHIPYVPPSERAKNASSVLDESLGKHNMKDSSLSKAIMRAIGKSLAINAVFAGVNTASSYVGPFLITNFVNYLLEKHDNSSIHHGLILAFTFFIANTLESLSQRQWYFGAQVFLALAILYRNLGAAPSAAALLSTILIMVCNTPLAKRQKRLHSKIMEEKDSRIKVTSEILKNIRVLKLHSWEPTFLKKLLQHRETERNWLKRYLYTGSAVVFLFWASPTLVSVTTFGVCIILNTPLTIGTVLSTLATFRILGEPIYNFPELISMITQTKVSIDRIQEFVKEDQMKLIPCHDSEVSNVTVVLEPGEYAWKTSEQDLKTPTITITEEIKIMKGSKVAVCGSVGSGKSSLLLSILGEIPKISGAGAKVYGTKAYVSQSAWIQTGTIRDNVLFGKEMNRGCYEEVLEICALDQDVNTWADGDLTVVGERGITLSGGEKQRVQLARAVYSDSDVYIFDDPFSAVDAHTGTHLFKKCLLQHLSMKTVIYATHQLEFLEAADLVLVIKDGEIAESGKYEDLIANPNGELVRQMSAHKKSFDQVNTCQQDNRRPHQVNLVKVSEEKEAINNGKLSEKNHEEEAETGRVKWRVYSTFVTSAYRGALVPVILVCQVLFQGLQMGSNYWMAWGTEKEDRVSKERLMWVFALLSAGSSIFILGRAVFLATIALQTAQRLFLGMITSVFRAPISFFDSTPSSRILSRCSTDQSTVDTDIPYRLAGLVFALIQLISIIILMSQVAWQVFILCLGVLALSMWYQAYYITTARELARMVGIRKAPILHHFSESIAGAGTVRCFNQEDRFMKKTRDLVDDYSRIVFHNYATMEWLSVRTNFLFNLVYFILLIILVSLPRSAIDPSLAGLAATYGLNLNVLQAWVIWNTCNVENKMISVERILQFTKIPIEAPLVIEDSRPVPEWPMAGKIEIENLRVQYNPALPTVLKGITCTFPGGKKIGIVGRTGSGKSTLIQALFRIVEPSGGQILIDGVDISKIGLQDLRSRLSIIPQDPTLFQGTMRTNLDPLQQHSDQELWEVLNQCRLAEIVRQDQRLLDTPVAEDGENWSVGQRQLVCLARVLLKKRKILVLDEATASIDTATDILIQQTIRKETSGCTVITVAHRIPTVIENDLVLVLDEGRVSEYGSPARLLEDSSSAFSKLVAEFLRRSSMSKGQ
ncbi:putative ABC transporter C family member 15 [Prunus yedoensis var. nudiflora]|uniref:ABC-type xenobiotic transporter n=1 Tax=Prunus yedoensis var. nudiflora TaxID=2094558 RepID=A0A314UZN0_PRUYE|nr:putative ABC transporter C family member 15 [Prunus yedoensis var. nudiflora]